MKDVFFKRRFHALSERYQRTSIRGIVTISFSLIAAIGMIALGITLYGFFERRTEETLSENTEQLLKQTATNLESYLRSMRLISDAMYYSVIKEADLSTDTLDREMNLLYDVNKDDLISISCFYHNGTPVASVPFVAAADEIDVTTQAWFESAVDEVENLHFSTPHVEHLFDNTSQRYYWVVSLSRAVELTDHGRTAQGVLLIDMNYSSIEQLFEKVNRDRSAGYVYLCDGNGEIIYHPRQSLIYAGLFSENNGEAVGYPDGTRRELFSGEERFVTVKTVGYTGWKIVSVIPAESLNVSSLNMGYYIIALFCIIMIAMIPVNQIVSSQLMRPLDRLARSVRVLDNGILDPEIYVGGSPEVRYLGNTLRDAAEKMRGLLDDFVREQDEKRKNELDALQSQINPHFLYNTLDSIIWMIEGERYKDAVFMIKELASLFRISLSRGRSVIPLSDEITHARNYMHIQNVRYRNTFTTSFEIEKEILDAATVKLILQPILENAIYYGVASMDGDGEIMVRGFREGDDVVVEIRDNGLGMPKEAVSSLLTGEGRSPVHGSGVGLTNVHKRIRLRFGEAYGLSIQSEPDLGTTVTVRMPYEPYEEERK